MEDGKVTTKVYDKNTVNSVNRNKKRGLIFLESFRYFIYQY